jgi:hypothetical protein
VRTALPFITNLLSQRQPLLLPHLAAKLYTASPISKKLECLV